ncbi:MAG: hypothetical protein Q9P01_16640 [Anaerolineae bacterium]|nr:hypothetical protein [Anaerolineae bacterium]
MNKRKTLLLLSLIVVALIAAACGSTGDSDNDADSVTIRQKTPRLNSHRLTQAAMQVVVQSQLTTLTVGSKRAMPIVVLLSLMLKIHQLSPHPQILSRVK